jgi:gliding motility-associated-like protein
LTDSNGNPVNSPFPATFRTATQTITARVTNNTTNDPGGPCFDETPIAFVVDVTPIAHTIDMTPVCDDESNDGLYDFDTSTIQSTLLGGQTGMEVHYYDGTGNELSSPLPNPFVSSSQTITVTVINPINTTCFATNTFELVVNPLPDFSVNTPQILCLTEPASIIILDISLEDDPQEVFDYEWTDQHGTLLSNTSSVAVNAPGTYSIALIKTDGTNCSRTRDIVVNPSMIADIDLYDIQIEDDSNNNTITINNENNNLGVGDYEFSLDDEFFFQDEPYFDFVESGIHTIYIRDKNGCGVNSIDVSVIGFPRFFSPNNDGYNDTWKVLGVNEIFYPEAKIYIFNRFGKLIKQIEPNNDSWDGIFNGAILPATDYWFSAELVDINGNIRIRKGHFSLIRR